MSLNDALAERAAQADASRRFFRWIDAAPFDDGVRPATLQPDGAASPTAAEQHQSLDERERVKPPAVIARLADHFAPGPLSETEHDASQIALVSASQRNGTRTANQNAQFSSGSIESRIELVQRLKLVRRTAFRNRFAAQKGNVEFETAQLVLDVVDDLHKSASKFQQGFSVIG